MSEALASSSGAASSSGVGRPKKLQQRTVPVQPALVKVPHQCFLCHINQNAWVCGEGQVAHHRASHRAHHTARKENQVSAACIDARD